MDDSDLSRPGADLTSWARATAAARRGDLARVRAELAALEPRLYERLVGIQAALSEQSLDIDVPPLSELTAPEQTARLARVPTAVEIAVERARAASASIARRRGEAERLRKTIAADTETEQVARELARLMSAKRFPQWLADAALDTLVADASSSLLQLSGGQFELTHDRGEFFVIDHADADSARSVKTLSGGETFQASLALALALSEQLSTLAAGGRTTLDSIFLDEGFGTLDPDALEIVAGTLENLAQGNRMVGVVTHVARAGRAGAGAVRGERDSRYLDHRAGGRMRFSVDGWDPGYGTSLGDRRGRRDGGRTCAPTSSGPPTAGHRWSPPRCRSRLDRSSSTASAGSRPSSGSTTSTMIIPGGRPRRRTPALCASYAAGAVCCCEGGAHFLEPELRRAVVTVSSHATSVRDLGGRLRRRARHGQGRARDWC